MSPTQNEDPQPDPRESLNDLVAGGLCLFVSSGLAVYHMAQAGRLHDDFGRDIGPAFLPVALLIALGLAGLGLVLRGGIRLRGQTRAKSGSPLVSLLPAVMVILILLLFLPIREVSGAATALAAIGAALALLAGRTDPSFWPLTAATGAVIGLVLFAVFRYGLSVPL